MKEQPEDLAAMEADELARQRAICDQQLAPLFRRWPALSRAEIRELRTIYAKRLRIAARIGRRRARRAFPE